MGLSMATNIHKYLTDKSLPPLQYWNRTISRGDPLKQIGGNPCQSPQDIVHNCDIIFISVHRLPTTNQHQTQDLTFLVGQRRRSSQKSYQQHIQKHLSRQQDHCRHNNCPPLHHSLHSHPTNRPLSILHRCTRLRLHACRTIRTTTHRARRPTSRYQDHLALPNWRSSALRHHRRKRA
jgi:hypothetical protein